MVNVIFVAHDVVNAREAQVIGDFDAHNRNVLQTRIGNFGAQNLSECFVNRFAGALRAKGGGHGF